MTIRIRRTSDYSDYWPCPVQMTKLFLLMYVINKQIKIEIKSLSSLFLPVLRTSSIINVTDRTWSYVINMLHIAFKLKVCNIACKIKSIDML